MRISIETAKELLKKGEVVALPTDTVYGLAACMNQKAAVSKIFTLKKRPQDNPLIIHIAAIEDVLCYLSQCDPSFLALAEAFWPGPLTLVMPVKEDLILDSVRASLQTAAFRMPSYAKTIEIIKETGPLVMPSANLSGKPSATSPEDVEEDFGLDFPVVDGGRSQKGIESTILIFSNHKWEVGRVGTLPLEQIEKVLGYFPEKQKSGKLLCPGQKYRHYAPKAHLILSKFEPEEVEAIIGFKGRNYSKDKKCFVLSENNQPDEACENLYHILRTLDRENIKTAWVDMNMPRGNLWETLLERINKAAS